MKNALKALVVVCLMLLFSPAYSQDKTFFNRFFLDKTLRVDYYHTGTKGQETISLDKIYEEGKWPGSKDRVIDTLNLGEFLFKVYDVSTNMLIYSRGYSTMFNEWQTTDEAGKGIFKTFSETVRFPLPKQKIQLTISRRDKEMVFREIFSTVIDPNSPVEVNRERSVPEFKVVPLISNGSSEEKVDLLFLGDGYAKEDMEKYRKDVRHFTDVLFSVTPFKERKKDFNVWAIEVISTESGIDKPDKNIWKKTVLGTSYNTFGSARYVLTEENRALRDIAAAAPYDFIAILVNDDRYGGGGILHLYTTCYTKADNPEQEWQRDYVFVHELGHSLAGLGDEYYSSQVAYTDFYPKGIEPWEPNITALLNKGALKWKKFVAPETPVPTPWEKAEYDSLERERAKLDRLAPDYYQKREPFFRRLTEIREKSKYSGNVGAFEGAGYISEGLYRPSVDCRMFSLSLVDFDPVCRDAIERMIDFYSR